MTEITVLEDLEKAEVGSFYTILGAGGDLQRWVDEYEKIFTEREVGKPSCWYRTTGADVNAYASKMRPIRRVDQFEEHLTILLFPCEDLNVGKLALVKLVMSDRWFDDIIANMQMGAY